MPDHPLSQSRCLPDVGIGRCLLGEAVRYNGTGKRRNPHIAKLAPHVNLIPICPELGIGLGVPRKPIRIVDFAGHLRAVDSDTQTRDFTEELQGFARRQRHNHPGLCGHILVKGSPSCGIMKVKRYDKNGDTVANDATGIFARQLSLEDPLLPLEEDGRLYDAGLRESFVSRVFLYHHWHQLRDSEITVDKLIRFYARYKYQIMAHDITGYRKLGQLLAQPHLFSLPELANRVITLMMASLQKVATRKSYSNTLQHIRGYLRKHLDRAEKAEISRLIQQYRDGIVPLVAPMTLLRHHFLRRPNTYIEQQVFMAPYPEELALRSHL